MPPEARLLRNRARDCLNLAKSVRTEADASILEDIASDLRALAAKLSKAGPSSSITNVTGAARRSCGDGEPLARLIGSRATIADWGK
jgi:hypothetical protein